MNGTRTRAVTCSPHIYLRRIKKKLFYVFLFDCSFSLTANRNCGLLNSELISGFKYQTMADKRVFRVAVAFHPRKSQPNCSGQRPTNADNLFRTLCGDQIASNLIEFQ